MTTPSSNNTASPWAKKLVSKLGALTETSSKESIQTLAKWIGFNRKHAPVFGAVLLQHLLPSPEQTKKNHKGSVVLSVLHQVLLLHSPTSAATTTDSSSMDAWNKLAELRRTLGTDVLVPAAPHLYQTANASTLDQYLQEWESRAVFGSSTNSILEEFQTRQTAPSQSTTTTTTTSVDPGTTTVANTTTTTKTSESTTNQVQEEAPSSTTAVNDDDKNAQNKEDQPEEEEEEALPFPQDIDQDEEPSAPPTDSSKPSSSGSIPKPAAAASSLSMVRRGSATTSTTSTVTTTTYDLESKGIPQAPVQMKELQDPCRSVATFQIARELHNDTAQKVASLLSELPEPVRTYLQQQQKKPKDDSESTPPPLPKEETIRDWSLQVSDAALDLDLEEQLANVQLFANVVEQQRKARQLLIVLLIRSRCRFGSAEAAQAMMTRALQAAPELQRRKQVLVDAMDLEGLELSTGEQGDENDKARADAAEQEVQQAQRLTLHWWQKENDKPQEEEETAAGTKRSGKEGDSLPNPKKARVEQ